MGNTKGIKLLVLDVDGTMTDGGVYVMEDGKQFKKFHARDGLGIKLAMKAGVEVGIISHSLVTTMVESRANMLGMKYTYVGQEPKIDILNQWIEKMDLSLEQVAYIGDDVNDLDIMQAVGLTACPADAAQEIVDIADIVLTKKGGESCVREFIDTQLLK